MYRDACVTPVCVQKKKEKKKKNNPKMKIHIEAANRGLTSATNSAKTEPFFPPNFRTFVVLPCVCMHRTGQNDATETAEHKQQQPHNDAVNKEDVSASLCFPANKQNGFRNAVKEANNTSRSNRNDPAGFCENLSREDLKKREVSSRSEGRRLSLSHTD